MKEIKSIVELKYHVVYGYDAVDVVVWLSKIGDIVVASDGKKNDPSV